MAPRSKGIHHSYRSDIAKVFEALAGRAFAELEALNQVIHRQRARGNEDQTVEFRQGPGLPEQPRKLDEEVNDLGFQRLESSGRFRRFNIQAWFFFVNGQDHGGDSSIRFNLFNQN